MLPRRHVVSRLILLTLVVSVAVISVISVTKAMTWVDRPFAGFLVNERLVLGNIGQYHWAGTEAGLKWPDKILRADGRAITSMGDLDETVRRAELGTPIVYAVEREGQVREVTVRTMRFGWDDLLMTFGITFVSGLVYILIGVTVFVLKPDTKVSWAFLSACVFLSLFAITSFDIQSTHAGFIRIYLLVNTFWPAAFLHLGLVFPARREFVERRPALQVAPYALSMLLLLPLELLYPHPAFLVLYQLVRLYGILSAVTMLVSTLEAYFRGASVLARQRAKVVLFGAALAFPLPALASYLSLFGGEYVGFAIQNNFLAIPIAVFPVSVAYAIAKHNLFDVDVYIKRAVGYGMMTAIVGVAYFSTQTLIGTVLLRPLLGDRGDAAAPLVFAVLVVFLFNPVSQKVQLAVDKIFFRKAYDYKGTISAVSNALTSMLRLDQIMTQVVDTIRAEMFVDTAGVIVLEHPSRTCQTLLVGETPAAPGDDRRQVALDYDDPLLARIRDNRMLVTKYDLEENPEYRDIRGPASETLRALAASLAIPLVYRDEVSGVLTLGYKKSGQFYGREDIDLLTTMANQAAVAVANAMTHEEVVRYAEDLAASLRRIQILESIKSNLAKFVPATVQALIEESPEAPLLEKREADVSVLFADITGYTRLSAQMELHQVNQLVERYFGAFLDEIIRCGGDVNETVGDGLMVIFRDADPPRHARAAITAALAIQRRTREINAELQGQSEPIVMHLGVNSGIASVGATKIEGAAGSRWTYTASGSTTNVAARVAALSEGGAIILSEETRRRLGDEFPVEDLGLQALKNVPEPVRVYRLDVDVQTGARA
ncbi:MAG: GAF domain-containing protein [Candidatus Rokubacteria bacterium]|nr:GAF domain-containing protein [Candidatus Rokubacteria bacterium]